MRTQFGTFGVLALLAGALAAAGGCDDITAGQVSEPKGPPRLIKVLVQDAVYVGGPPLQRAAAVDLLDRAPPPSCSDSNPCVSQFLIAQTQPPLDCSDPAGGVCVDPLAPPADGVPLNDGATSIRLVFSKLLDSSIEQVAVDDHGAPKGRGAYTLAPGIVELLGPDGQPVADTTVALADSGAPDFTSDIILNPFGPALVIAPGSLAPSSRYTVRIHPAMLKDRKGQGAVDQNGTPLGDPTDIAFTTEAVTPNPDLSYPDFTAAPTIAPNEVLQLAYWALLDEATVTVTATGPAGFDATRVEAYSDRGADPDACADSLNPGLLDFVYTTGGAARTPVDWPAGDYTLSFHVKDTTGLATYDSPTLSFTVAGADADPAADANVAAQHLTPEQCN